MDVTTLMAWVLEITGESTASCRLDLYGQKLVAGSLHSNGVRKENTIHLNLRLLGGVFGDFAAYANIRKAGDSRR